jgi:hypothetical protein
MSMGRAPASCRATGRLIGSGRSQGAGVGSASGAGGDPEAVCKARGGGACSGAPAWPGLAARRTSARDASSAQPRRGVWGTALPPEGAENTARWGLGVRDESSCLIGSAAHPPSNGEHEKRLTYKGAEARSRLAHLPWLHGSHAASLLPASHRPTHSLATLARTCARQPACSASRTTHSTAGGGYRGFICLGEAGWTFRRPCSTLRTRYPGGLRPRMDSIPGADAQPAPSRPAAARGPGRVGPRRRQALLWGLPRGPRPANLLKFSGHRDRYNRNRSHSRGRSIQA